MRPNAVDVVADVVGKGEKISEEMRSETSPHRLEDGACSYYVIPRVCGKHQALKRARVCHVSVLR